MADSKPFDMEAFLRTLAPAPPLQLVSVDSRGVPNEERIYLKANQRVNLREYFLVLGVRMPDGTVYPGQLGMWLGNGTVEAGGWIVVYTGGGSPLVTKMQGTGEPALVVYWGHATTLFNDAQLTPILVHSDKIEILPP